MCEVLTSLVNKFTMELNPANTSKDTCNVNKGQKLINTKDIEELSSIYPYGHRIPHQMRSFYIVMGNDLFSNNCF